MPEHKSERKNNDFFVGYLDTPPALKKFYWHLIIGLIACSSLLGYGLSSIQNSAVPAIWDLGASTTMSGVLTLDPYPVLHRLSENSADNPEKIESVLLVNQGKHSARQLTADFDNKAITISGALISRGGWLMLEIGAPEDIKLNNNINVAAIKSKLNITPMGKISLSGEIADTKCFLGVMKPGAGKIHKACAEVCLLGGIPAMLVSKGKDGKKYGYILAKPDGSSASKITAKHAAEAVRISGTLQQQGDILYIKMDENGLQRI